MAATKVDRDAVLAALFEQWSVLEQLLRTLDAEAWLRPTALPGWTVRDIAAHIIGTESELDGRRAPEAPEEILSAEHVRNAIGALNERWVFSMSEDDPERIMDRWTALMARRRRALEDMPQSQFDAQTDTPVGPESYGRFMRLRVFDCWMHELDIRDTVGRPGEEGGPRAELAFTEIAGAIPYLVGKKAAAPDGARVRLALTGPLARTIDLQVDGRAAVVSRLDRAPDVTVTMPSGLFVRLAGGRAAAQDHGADILSEPAPEAPIGRREAADLGARIPAALAFTI